MKNGINGMNLGASPESCSAASSGELHPTFSSAEAGREGGLQLDISLSDKKIIIKKIILSKKIIEKIILLSFFFACTACEEMFQFSPFGANVSNSKLNESNIGKILSTQKLEDTLHIAAFADSHNYYDDLKSTIVLINSLPKIDFIIFLGDATETGLSNQFEWYLTEMLKLHKPFITVIGNHDFIANGSTIYTKMFGSLNFYFDYFGYRFIGFNDVVWENDNKAPDFDWLEGALKSRNPELRPIIMAHIQPWTDAQLGDTYSPIYEEIAEANNVILSVGGHIHEFQNTIKNGITYLSSGSVNTRGISIIHLYKNDIRIERVEF